MGINAQLLKLYSRAWAQLEPAAKNVTNIAHPLLIKVDENEFANADIKVMIFGQETDGWCGKFPLPAKPLTVCDLMDTYDNYYRNSKDKNKRPFWNNNNFKFFQKELSRFFYEANKSTYFVWNNISKIGKTGRGRATIKIRDVELKHFKVIDEEINILNPDIIIFTTGASRDKYIREAFGKDEVEIDHPRLAFTRLTKNYELKNMVSTVKFSKFPNICAVRVEHPNRRTLANSIIVDVIKEYWDDLR